MVQSRQSVSLVGYLGHLLNLFEGAALALMAVIVVKIKGSV
jgi:hypothetical protein